jgi:L-fuconolactonase
MRVDAHHHLWHYLPDQYAWIDDRMQVLRRDFLPCDLDEAISPANIHATVAVQSRQTLEETDWLLKLAWTSSIIRGVVGWAPLTSNDFSLILDRLRHNPLLRGLRHVVQGEATGFLDREDFNRGISAMRDTDLVYDLLIYAPQLEESIRLIDRHPRQIFVLDHIGKPDIAGGGFHPWSLAIRELAQRDNVVCKLSGMVTEADWEFWTPADLHPYYETVLEAFGPNRLMVGSDWPVLSVACGYTQWWQIVSDWLTPLSNPEREQIEGGVAERIYRLSPQMSPLEPTP